MANNKRRFFMGFLFSAWFWGAVVVLIGLSIILKAVFDINIPLFRILFGGILILLGLRLIFGLRSQSEKPKSEGNVIFNEEKMNYDPGQKDYNVIFGSAEIDLRKAAEKNGAPIQINTVFGRAVVILPAKTPVRLGVTTAFAESRLPNGNRAGAFGEVRYQSEDFSENKAAVDVRGNAVFGQMVFRIGPTN